MDWFLYDSGLHHERVKENTFFTHFVKSLNLNTVTNTAL